MPTYEYTCTTCGHDLEAVQKFTDDPLTECPECGGPLRKVYGAVGIVLKGSGFYKTDSRAAANGNGNSNGKRSSDSDSKGSDSSSSEKSDSSASKSSDAKGSDSKGSDSKGSGGKEAKPAASTTSSS